MVTNNATQLRNAAIDTFRDYRHLFQLPRSISAENDIKLALRDVAKKIFHPFDYILYLDFYLTNI